LNNDTRVTIIFEHTRSEHVLRT